MLIDHVALWVKDLETMKDFYCGFFNAAASGKYINAEKGFSSYFLSFESGARLELMYREGLSAAASPESYGWAHLAVSAGSRAAVDGLTERLRLEGYRVKGEPGVTGDGYYESVVLDPEGNRIEITV